MDAFTRAATNRSIRTIRTELDFLLDAAVLSPAQAAQIAAILPDHPSSISSAAAPSPSPVPQQHQPYAPPAALPPRAMPPPQAAPQQPSPPPSSPSPISEKQPPSYGAAAGGGGVATAEALYAYQPTDAGDLGLAAGDRVVVLEWMNADWARGRSERSGAEGIFPRSYVRVADDVAAKGTAARLAGLGLASKAGYGSAPAESASGAPAGEASGKVNAQGKKFGKKLGNAAIFGAGATIGSNIVSGIF